MLTELPGRILLIGLTLLLVSACDTATSTPADLVVLNAKIYTMDAAPEFSQTGGTTATGMCVRGGRITWVGNDEDAARRCIGPETRILHLNGEAMLPGLVDTHLHIFSGSVSDHSVNLSLADTMEKLVTALGQLKAENPGSEPLFARGWQNHLFPPHGPPAAMLDKLFGDRVVVLGSVDGHSTWFSSKALESAGLDESAVDPEPGVSFYERNPETGKLLGTARESAGWSNAAGLIRQDISVYRSRFVTWLPRAAAAGLTSVFDAGMSAPTEDDAYTILSNLEKQGELTLRVYSSTPDRGGDDNPVARLAELKTQYSGEWIKPTAIKVFADGVPEAHTAFLSANYVDRPGFKGRPMTAAERVDQLLLAAQRSNLPVHTHAIGGAAINMVLNAIEQARAAAPGSMPRHTIAHMDLVDDADIKRFAELGVIAQTSIQWATRDPSYDNIASFVGDQVMEAAYPVRSLIDAGAVQTFGSDWPASAYLSTFKPLTLIEVAVTRRLPGMPDNPARNPGEALTVPQAVAAMTRSAAYQVGDERNIGTLEVNKKADFIVLSQNIFEVAPHTIHATESVLTVVGGEVVLDAM